jgi:hypothetical protein
VWRSLSTVVLTLHGVKRLMSLVKEHLSVLVPKEVTTVVTSTVDPAASSVATPANVSECSPDNSFRFLHIDVAMRSRVLNDMCVYLRVFVYICV